MTANVPMSQDSWRVFRIMAEFIEGFELMQDVCPAVTIFGSARLEEASPYYEATRQIAKQLGEAGYSIITGGGPGFMEAANRGASEVGAKSIGLNILLPYEQKVNSSVGIPMTHRYFFCRKVLFIRYAQAFIIMPGGFGTLDELFEALTLIQNGKIIHFPLILFGSKYWQPLIDWLKNTMLADGCISQEDLDIITLTDDINEVVTKITGESGSRSLVLD